jgi:hypothetical protein
MVSTSLTNVFTADQRIVALEQEIFNLRNAKRTFDGVEILKPACANKPTPTEQPRVLESMTKPAPPPEKLTATTQPPLHPFANVQKRHTSLPTSAISPPPLPNPPKKKSRHITMSPLSKTHALSSTSTTN